MKTKNSGIIFVCLVTALLLVACGGGSSSTPPSGSGTSTLSFPMQSAFNAMVANGWTKNFTSSGDCSGSGTQAVAPAKTAATFEGAAALSATNSTTYTFSNCTPASGAQIFTAYYDSNYVPRGFSDFSTTYGVYGAISIPSSVIVGGTGVLWTEARYTNSTKSTSIGSAVTSYIIEADTPTTAIVNLIYKIYNTANTLTQTQQVRYRISATGALTLVSVDTQSSNGSTFHIVWTYN